ncbi:hypothetical protein [Nocardioides jishulii]|uniref:Lipoprotein n=1 Tax=Nocardioides jishulii TaxID=2575440 RepID=A0A4U2YV14_9ACTN|nr:hypothetical protein [Nocardioides jishulii]QCX28302.1 hypothetical protein FCL41_12820 [Nocardioides jishulii]TKI64805.1 hypothetical protein FC770_06750 [Nocardioides jishulii]
MGRLLRTSALVLALTAVTACASQNDPRTEKESDVKPEQALNRMAEAFAEILAVAAPDADAGLAEPDLIPCGGLGGNERTKVKYRLESADGVTVADPAAALAAAEERARELGLETEVQGDTLNFHDETFSATLVSRPDQVLAFGETPCVDNPDR